MKKDAILNFLITISFPNYKRENEDELKARRCSKLYKWDKKTLQAVLDGIHLLHNKPKRFLNYLKRFI